MNGNKSPMFGDTLQNPLKTDPFKAFASAGASALAFSAPAGGCAAAGSVPAANAPGAFAGSGRGFKIGESKWHKIKSAKLRVHKLRIIRNFTNWKFRNFYLNCSIALSVALTILILFLVVPRILPTTLGTPPISKITRIGPPAFIPLPFGAGLTSTRAAPNLAITENGTAPFYRQPKQPREKKAASSLW